MQKLKTLVVEPEAAAATKIREVFERFGFQVQIASDTASAVQALAVNEFDFMTVDSHLPDENGVMCLIYIKNELKKRNLKTKLIAVAPEVTNELRVQFTLMGVNGVITKPYSFIPVAETLFTLN